MLDILVAGSGCSSCKELEERVKKVLEGLQMEATLRKVTDFNEMAALGVLVTPGLVVNGKLLSQGKMPTESTLTSWISKAAGK